MVFVVFWEGACVYCFGFCCYFCLFLPVADESHVYVRAWTLCCCHSLISTQTFSEGVASVCRQMCGDEEYPSCVTTCARFWRKVSESDARSVPSLITDQMLEMSMYGQNHFCVCFSSQNESVSQFFNLFTAMLATP